MNSCETTTKRLLHRASKLFILIFNNHKSANNQVQRNKTLESPVGWSQVLQNTTLNEQVDSGHTAFSSPQGSISRRCFTAGEAVQCSPCPFIPADPQTKKKAYTPPRSHRVGCHFSINFPGHFCKCR